MTLAIETRLPLNVGPSSGIVSHRSVLSEGAPV